METVKPIKTVIRWADDRLESVLIEAVYPGADVDIVIDPDPVKAAWARRRRWKNRQYAQVLRERNDRAE